MTRLSKFILLFLLLWSVPALGIDNASIILANLDIPQNYYARGDYYKGASNLSATCTSSISQLEDNTFNTLYSGDVNWQAIKSQGTSITVCQVDLKCYYSGTAGDLHVEFWDTGKTTQYGDDSDSITCATTSSSGAVYSMTWSGTEPVVPSGDFRMYIVKDDANSTKLRGHGDETKYEDTNYDLIVNSVDLDEDAYFNIYTR